MKTEKEEYPELNGVTSCRCGVGSMKHAPGRVWSGGLERWLSELFKPWLGSALLGSVAFGLLPGLEAGEWPATVLGSRLQRTTALTNPVWQDVPGSARVNSIALPVADLTGFFRLVQP